MPNNVIEVARNPSWTEVIQDAIEVALEQLHCSLPAKIISYDTTKQLATVQPMLKLALVDSSGNAIRLSRAVIAGVPVLWPSGGGMRGTFPLAAGDYVMLLMSDQSMDVWKASGGEVDPIDVRTHDIGDCVAIPGLHPNNKVWTSVSGSYVQFGQDGATADFVALASKIASILATLAAAFNGHSHTAFGSPPTPSPGLKIPLWDGATGTAPSTASGTVQILG